MDLLEAQTAARGRTRLAVGFALVLVAVAFGLIIASLSRQTAHGRPIAATVGSTGFASPAPLG
jgi:hypothetical protein